ncbi:hypothetical protein [Escherichia coli]|nr:hypothetical protein [Escherichia coli]
MLGGADNPNGELPSYITGANTGSGCYLAHREHMGAETPGEETEPALTLCMLSGTW